MRSTRIAPFRRGVALLYVVVVAIGIIALGSLAMDFAHVQLVKTELERCADAAARAAVQQLSSGITATQNAAVSVAATNTADGSAVVLDPATTGANADIEFGTWDTSARTFTVLSGTARSGANSVRVTARRTAARSTAVQMVLASVLGVNSIDCTGQSVAYITNRSSGIIGLNSITIHQNLFVASYNSGSTTAPSQTAHNNNGLIASNGALGIGATGTANAVYGDTYVGPSGSVNALVTVSGTSTTLATSIATPADPTFTAVTNPGSVSATPTPGAGTYNWPGGTYYFTSFSCNDNVKINFTGPATIYMDGNFTMHNSCDFKAYNSIPSNLVFYQATGKSFTTNDRCNLIMVYQGGGATWSSHDDGYFCGSLIAKTITLHDRPDIFYDEALGTGAFFGPITKVK